MIGDQNILFITDEEGNEIQMEIKYNYFDKENNNVYCNDINRNCGVIYN